MVDEVLASQPQPHLRGFNLITQRGVVLVRISLRTLRKPPQFPLRLIPGFTK